MKIDFYRKNWLEFNKNIAKLCLSGVSDDEISKAYADSIVEWVGVISEKKLDEEYAVGVNLTMENPMETLGNGMVLDSSHIFLNIEEGCLESWRQCELGCVVCFKAQIKRNFGPFPSIKIVKFPEDGMAYLEIGLYKVELICTNS